MIQHWKKFTLFQIREKIAIHYVQRLERKRVTLTYLHKWVRHHDSNKNTKREQYIMSRTQHHLANEHFCRRQHDLTCIAHRHQHDHLGQPMASKCSFLEHVALGRVRRKH
jgi:hypothetical protein